MTRHYSFSIELSVSERYRNVPYGVDINFDQLLKDKNIKGTFDRFSVIVKKVDSITGELKDVHFNLSDSFLTENKGRVNWLIEDTAEKNYVIFYDTKENGPFKPHDYIGLIGNGDCLRFNDGKPHALHVGMHSNPIAIDWDGDGMIDIVTPQMYSHTLGSPWFPVRFFRNEGTNVNPLFGDGIPLKGINGNKYEYLKCGIDIEICDWNGDGLQDMLVYPYSNAERQNAVYVYINTGKKDGAGLPLLELKHTLEVLPPKGLCTCMKVVDWFGDGRKSLLIGYIGTEKTYVNKDDPLWFKASAQEKESAQWPRWYYKNKIVLMENVSQDNAYPEFKDPVVLTTGDGMNISSYSVSSFDVVKHNRNSNGPDLLVMRGSDEFHKGFAGIEYYRNTGDKSRTVFEPCGKLQNIADRSSLYFRDVNTPAFKGLLVSHGSSGSKIKYYRFDGYDDNGLPLYTDKGFIMQRNTYMNSYSGFAQGSLCDWDEDGDWDIITGCETGFITRSENTGTQKYPVFKDFEVLEQGGRPIELLNGPFDDPGSFMEANIGQTAPMYIDWDADGILDLLVIIGQRFYFYKNRGTSGKPILEKPVEIKADDGKTVAKHRNKPAVIDWNGDGLPDIIGHDGEENGLYLFKHYRDEKTGELRLAAGIPFEYRDGGPVVPKVWHRYTKYFNAADWKGNGSYDIFLSTCDHILYLENVGTNNNPAFLQPVRFKIEDKPISIGHHVSTPFPVDWDKSGKIDLLVSGESGLFHLFRRNYLDGVHKKIGYKIT